VRPAHSAADGGSSTSKTLIFNLAACPGLSTSPLFDRQPWVWDSNHNRGIGQSAQSMPGFLLFPRFLTYLISSFLVYFLQKESCEVPQFELCVV